MPLPVGTEHDKTCREQPERAQEGEQQEQEEEGWEEEEEQEKEEAGTHLLMSDTLYTHVPSETPSSK